MRQYNLPDRLYCWAWTPEYLGKQKESGNADSFCRFSEVRLGRKFSWLWFFPDRRQAASLRIMQALPVHHNDLATVSGPKFHGTHALPLAAIAVLKRPAIEAILQQAAA